MGEPSQGLISILSNGTFLTAWVILALASLGLLLRDLQHENPQIGGLMKFVWILTVAYSGPIGLLIYGYSGRKQIARDSVWRRGFRSLAHCYSGCGAGEIIGVFIAAGLLSLSTTSVAVSTFILAYLVGYGLTVGPLLEEGVALTTALKDAFITETPSIFVMEVTAIAVDLWLSAGAGMGEVLFWSSLVFSLSMGLVAAYPVNVILIALGVKKGMADPRSMGDHAGAH